MHERRVARLAAWFAVSNLGHMHNMDESEAGDTHYDWPKDPRNAVENIAGHLMESDEHEEIFAEEAESWFERFKNLSAEEIREQYAYKSDQWFEDILAVPDEELEKMRW